MVYSGSVLHSKSLAHVPSLNHISQFTLQAFTSSVVKDALQAINYRKATGEDKLDPYFVQLCAPFIAEKITYLFNLSYFH